MKVCKSVSLGVIVCALVLGTTSVVAAPPPPPPGVHLMPGMVWCHRCGGHGRVPSGFMGWKDKRCPECNGNGMLRVRHHGAPVPPPQHHGHSQPAHHGHSQPVHHGHPQPAAPVHRGPVCR